MEIAEKLRLLNAYGAGETILSRNIKTGIDWHEDEHPTWDWDSFYYTTTPKFSRGDTVKVLDGSKIPNYTGGWSDSMEQCVGNYYTISSAHTTVKGLRYYRLAENSLWFSFDERGLELVKKGE